eukprot:8546338-Lingulodinium_polyedra.AAC.1
MAGRRGTCPSGPGTPASRARAESGWAVPLQCAASSLRARARAALPDLLHQPSLHRFFQARPR